MRVERRARVPLIGVVATGAALGYGTLDLPRIGDPASPVAGASPAAPARAKGGLVLHSAGRDGYYGESKKNEFQQIIYIPSSGGGVNATVTERDGIPDQLNDIVVGGGS